MKLGRVRVSRASGVPDTSQSNRDKTPDLLRAMSVRVSLRDGRAATTYHISIYVRIAQWEKCLLTHHQALSQRGLQFSSFAVP